MGTSTLELGKELLGWGPGFPRGLIAFFLSPLLSSLLPTALLCPAPPPHPRERGHQMHTLWLCHQVTQEGWPALVLGPPTPSLGRILSFPCRKSPLATIPLLVSVTQCPLSLFSSSCSVSCPSPRGFAPVHIVLLIPVH